MTPYLALVNVFVHWTFVLVHMEYSQTVVIFGGKGKRMSVVEKEAWDPDTDVYFQPNAWTDGNFCIEWYKITLKTAAQGKHHFVLIVIT